MKLAKAVFLLFSLLIALGALQVNAGSAKLKCATVAGSENIVEVSRSEDATAVASETTESAVEELARTEPQEPTPNQIRANKLLKTVRLLVANPQKSNASIADFVLRDTFKTMKDVSDFHKEVPLPAQESNTTAQKLEASTDSLTTKIDGIHELAKDSEGFLAAIRKKIGRVDAKLKAHAAAMISEIKTASELVKILEDDRIALDKTFQSVAEKKSLLDNEISYLNDLIELMTDLSYEETTSPEGQNAINNFILPALIQANSDLIGLQAVFIGTISYLNTRLQTDTLAIAEFRTLTQVTLNGIIEVSPKLRALFKSLVAKEPNASADTKKTDEETAIVSIECLSQQLCHGETVYTRSGYSGKVEGIFPDGSISVELNRGAGRYKYQRKDLSMTTKQTFLNRTVDTTVYLSQRAGALRGFFPNGDATVVLARGQGTFTVPTKDLFITTAGAALEGVSIGDSVATTTNYTGTVVGLNFEKNKFLVTIDRGQGTFEYKRADLAIRK